MANMSCGEHKIMKIFSGPSFICYLSLICSCSGFHLEIKIWPLILYGYVVPGTWSTELEQACCNLKYPLTIYLYTYGNIYSEEEILNLTIFFYKDAGYTIHPLHPSASYLLMSQLLGLKQRPHMSFDHQNPPLSNNLHIILDSMTRY